ncbi:hypothetical protein NPIL_635691 [Nephila pilipes]|uniref:Uncharacterized protein n=1 Tax=Nephila pilipes TaxID=299642 RepID=A0A8X6N5K8_NEPPI|nr:hypothetical protein NPIL_635691 [Nephila pilipes]
MGKSQVFANGSSELDLVIDEDRYPLTLHILPTKHLNLEAVIDTDILEQTSLKFTEDSVEFLKYGTGSFVSTVFLKYDNSFI